MTCRATYRIKDSTGVAASHSMHSGQEVNVLCFMKRSDYGPVYRIQTNDGWLGVAWTNELEIIEGELPSPPPCTALWNYTDRVTVLRSMGMRASDRQQMYLVRGPAGEEFTSMYCELSHIEGRLP